ncbi:YDG domain-containing protein [Gemmatimonas sp.]|uniref:YDG domain-containing protein n=1 Tax=Gemmatimonas sp. TaxID=1962908 RepID=UPI003983B183
MSMALAGAAAELGAQTVISVPFTSGFAGNRGTSAGTANNVLTFATLQIARIFFIQSSSTNTFEIQGNDIPGTMRIVRTDGTILDIPASANWRNSGGTTYLIGFLPRPVSPITLTYSGGSIQITDGAVNGGSSIGGYAAGYAGTKLADGQSTNGNAAISQVLAGLNDYLATVVASRPAGPVTVTALSTSSTTPTITGTATVGTGEVLTVVVNGVQYSTSTSPAIVRSGTSWSLTLTTPLPTGTYEVAATITNTDGFTLSDTSTNEVTITPVTTTVTIGGSFTANDKVYSGDTTATGTTTGLTLVGVSSPDNVTIAAITLGFLTSPVGTAKSVVITGVTLGGTDAGLYTVSLTGAPSATANITPKPLTLAGSFTASNKVYNGSTSATVATNSLTLVGVVSPDVVTLASVTATFATASVGNGKTVSPSAATISGANSGNYSISVSGAPTTTANITSAGGTVTIGGSLTANDKVYSGDTTATGTTTGLTLVGVNSSDNVTISAVTLGFLTAPAGTAKSVVITGVTLGGTDAGLYTVSLTGAPSATANITPKPLTLAGSFTASNKVYNGSTSATVAGNSLTLVGVVSPDVVTLSGVTATFATASVGTGKPVSLSAATIGGANSGNYSIGVSGAPTTSANITSAGGTVTIGGSFTANDKVYSGTTTAIGNTSTLMLVGVSSPDNVTIASVTIAFTTAPVGSTKTVVITNVTLVGSQAGLYTVNLAGAPTTTADITAIPLTIGGSFEANEKLYDGTTAVTIAGNTLALVGVRDGDNVTLTAVTFAFADPTVGTQKPVGIISSALGGSAASNYSLSLNGAPVAAANILALTPPSVPRAVVGIAGDGRITLTLDIPANEGCRAVSGYVVEYSTDNGTTWKRTLLDGRAVTPWVLQGLTNNVPTRVRVAAVNPCGMSPFVEVPGPFVPIGPTRTTGGQPTTTPRGTGTLSSSNTPVTLEVVRDTILRLSDGTVMLSLRSSDGSGSAIPIDSSRTMQLDQGGRATTEGSGFAPGTYVSVYIYAPNGTPILLGTVLVGSDGTFQSTVSIPLSLPPGAYTLQVNGIDRTHTPRSASLGVDVAEPPADVELTAVPDQSSPVVGDTITITLTVLNKGTGPAINVIIPRAFTEAGFTIVKSTPIDGSYNDLSKQWTVPRIEPGARARLLLTAIVLPPAALQPNTP